MAKEEKIELIKDIKLERRPAMEIHDQCIETPMAWQDTGTGCEEGVNILLLGEDINGLFSSKERYVKELAALEEAVRQLVLRQERHELAEEPQATLKERDRQLTMISELEGKLEGLWSEKEIGKG